MAAAGSVVESGSGTIFVVTTSAEDDEDAQIDVRGRSASSTVTVPGHRDVVGLFVSPGTHQIYASLRRADDYSQTSLLVMDETTGAIQADVVAPVIDPESAIDASSGDIWPSGRYYDDERL